MGKVNDKVTGNANENGKANGFEAIVAERTEMVRRTLDDHIRKHQHKLTIPTSTPSLPIRLLPTPAHIQS